MSTKINRLDDSSSFYLAGFQPRTLDSKNRVITVIRNVQQVANIIPFVNLQPSGGRLDDLNITADVASTLIIEEELWKAQVEILYDRGLPVHLAEKIVSYLSDPSKVRYTRREKPERPLAIKELPTPVKVHFVAREVFASFSLAKKITGLINS